MGGPQPENYWNVLPPGALRVKPEARIPEGWQPPRSELEKERLFLEEMERRRRQPPPAQYKPAPPVYRLNPQTDQFWRDINT